MAVSSKPLPGPLLETTGRDFRIALRGLLRAPGFAAAALLTLGLGIGSTTAVFSVFRSVLLQPLPFPDSDRLVRVFESNQGLGGRMAVAYPDFLDWAGTTRAFAALAAYRPTSMALTGVGEARRLEVLAASASLFATLGVTPQKGRFFDAAEDRAGGAAVIVISNPTWRDRLGGGADVLGRGLTLDGKSYTVVGVLPPGFKLPGAEVDAIAPLAPLAVPDRDAHQLRAVGRLRPGATLAQAREEIAAAQLRLAAAYPVTNQGIGARLEEWREIVVGDARPALRVLLAAVALVALIACVNFANLLLARGLARSADSAVRAALGAGRRHLMSISLAESTLLAVVGGALGVGLAAALVRMLVTLNPPGLARADEIHMDVGALAVAIGLTVLCALVAGWLPGFMGSRPDLVASLQGAGRGTAGDSGRRRLRRALVAAEIGTALVLLLGAGLALRSLAALRDVETGFDARGVLTAHMALPPAYYQLGRVEPFYSSLTERLSAEPGVEAAGTIDFLPFSTYDSQTTYRLAGQPEAAPGQELWADVASVGGRYFSALRIALLRGRLFDARDRVDAPPRILVDRRFVETHFRGEDPIGRQVVLGGQSREIVGVVEHVRNYGLDNDPRVQVYIPAAQAPAAYTHIVMRATPPAGGRDAGADQARTLRTVVRGLDADLPVDELGTLDSRVSASLGGRRFNLLLLGGFAGSALFLAAIGIFGVLSYSVLRRTRELGVRRALGADRGAILLLVVREGLSLAALGCGAGLLLALPMLRLMRSTLFGIGASDPLAWLGAIALILVVVILAAVVPARRAAAVEPAEALRSE